MDMNYLHDQEGLEQSTQKVDEERRAFLTAGLVGGAIAAGTLAVGAAHAQQTAAAPAPALSDKPWWPHPKWGKDDQAGASNWITPAKVLDTIKIIKDGKIYRVGRVYEAAMPKYGQRTFNFRITPVGRGSAPTGWSVTTSSWPPRLARRAPSSTGWVTSASRWASPATWPKRASTTASPSLR